jgi:hypothetical protein
MIRPAATPPPLGKSKFAYGGKPPTMRAADLPDICSVRVQDLFGDIPDPIHRAGEDTTPVREAAVAALDRVDMSMIKPGDSVNVLCSEHGFGMMGGHAYAELLRAVHDEVVRRTGTENVRLAMSSANSKFEQIEIVPQFGLDQHYRKVYSFGPYDNGVAIDTEIGRLYGIQRAYAAKWLIHVHYDDPREVHFHHMNGRLLKAFTMSYARMETRSIFHNNFPTRSANIVPRAVYESPFIRQRWAFSAVLSTSPTGTMGVDADNDLVAMDRRVTVDMLRRYGKLIELFRTIDACYTVADDTRWLPYQHAGGLTATALFESSEDHLDLDFPATPPNPPSDKSPVEIAKGAVRATVMNYAWKLFTTTRITVAADPDVGKDMKRIHPDREIHVAADLPEAMKIAAEKAGTDKAIVFDGCYGAINMTRPLAEYLIARAPEVARRVDEELMPKWLRQRNLRPAA